MIVSGQTIETSIAIAGEATWRSEAGEQTAKDDTRRESSRQDFGRLVVAELFAGHWAASLADVAIAAHNVQGLGMRRQKRGPI